MFRQALPLGKQKVNSRFQTLREQARWLCNRRGLRLFCMVQEVTVAMSADGSYNPRLTRRQLLASLGWAGASVALAGPAAAWARRSRGANLVRLAASTKAAGSDLGAIDHIVFLMMENRSYDHYFGAYPKGRGFDDHPAGSLGVFAQAYPGATNLSPPNVLLPFHLGSTAGEECTDDLTHDWARSISAGTAARWTVSFRSTRRRPTRGPTGR